MIGWPEQRSLAQAAKDRGARPAQSEQLGVGSVRLREVSEMLSERRAVKAYRTAVTCSTSTASFS